MNPYQHCSTGSTPHDGPQMVRLLTFFFKVKRKKIKIIKSAYWESRLVEFADGGALRKKKVEIVI